MRLDRADVRRVAELTAALRSATGSGSFVATEVLPELRTMLGFDRAGQYSFHIGAQNLSIESLHFAGPVRSRLKADFDAALQKSAIWAFDPSRPARAERNRAIAFRAGAIAPMRERVAAVAHLVERHPWVEQEHQLRLLVCEGPALLAWIGGFRGGARPFTDRERSILQALAGPLKERLAFERDFGDGKLAVAALAAALEEIGAPAFVVSGAGRVLHANAAGRARLDRRSTGRAEVEAALSSGGDPRYRWTKLEVKGLASHFLAVERRAAPEAVARAEACAVRWGLTPRQAEVLALVARGNANKTIAAALRCSEATVEFHVTALLQKAGCGCRAELVAQVWAQE